MENFYEEVYQYLIEKGIDDDEATEVVNYLYEENIHEYGLLTENRGKAVLNMLRAVGMMSGILKKPGAKQAVKQVTKKVQGTPLQGNLLTKTGKAQNFTGGRTPFTGTSPVPAASSKLPIKSAPTPEAPGQLRIPGMSDTAQTLSRISGKPMGPGGLGITMSGSTKGLPRRAPKPEFGPGAVKPPAKPPKPELRPDGVAPKPEFKVPSTPTPTPAPRTNKQADAVKALKQTQPMSAPKVDGPSALTIKQGDKTVYSIPKKDVLTPSQMKAQRTADKVRALKVSTAVGGATATTMGVNKLVSDANKDSAERNAQRKSKLAQQEAETRAADAPKPEPTGERSAKANQEKQEKAKAEAEKTRRSKDQLSAAAKDFDKTFASARKEGKKEFTWRGKKYNTKLKGE